MIDTTSFVTTQRAAQLLQAHESSIKRWCNAETLPCTYTPGGHRRIPLEGLLQFAHQQALPCRLLNLHPFEEATWQGLNQVWSDDRFEDLIALCYRMLKTGTGKPIVPLFRFILEMDVALPTLIDRLLSPVLYRVGNAWHEGALNVGDEHRMTEHIRDSLYALLYTLPAAPVQEPREKPVAVVGCGRTEAHDLGALMVRLWLTATGWDVVYLGGRVPTEDFALQQIKHRASLVCVSFAPPEAVPEALHTVRMLAPWYDPDRPYRLALGGNGLCDLKVSTDLSTPFIDLAWFEDVQSFARWLES